jgi:hypothetical protein
MAEEASQLDLSESEWQEAQERTSATVRVVYEAVRREGEDELKRTSSALAWSSLQPDYPWAFP